MQEMTLNPTLALSFWVWGFPVNLPAFVGYPPSQSDYVPPDPFPATVTDFEGDELEPGSFTYFVQISDALTGDNPFAASNPWKLYANGVLQSNPSFVETSGNVLSWGGSGLAQPVVLRIPFGPGAMLTAGGHTITPGDYVCVFP